MTITWAERIVMWNNEVPRHLPVRVAALHLLLWFGSLGCSDSPTPTETLVEPVAETAEVDPLMRLHQMAAAYREATSYSDQGIFRLQYRQQGKLVTDEAPFAVAFEQPNLLMVRAYHAQLASDGQHLRAQIVDEGTRNLDGQLLVTKALSNWNLNTLFDDEVLRGAVVQGMGRHPLPLELLIAEEPLEAIFHVDTAKQFLSPQTLEERRCVRIAAETGEGRFVFWIDDQSHELRRLEYPPQIFLSQIADESISDVRVTAEFRHAELDPPITQDQFALTETHDTTVVAILRVPPRPLPTQLFGKRPQKFSVQQPNGKPLTQASLDGKIATLLWFNDHPLGRAAVQQLDQLGQKLQDDDRYRFVAVCTEPSSRSTSDLTSLVRSWGVRIPWVRDLNACGRDVFQIPWAPTLVVLDSRGQVQAFEVGYNPALVDGLPPLLERLADGDDVAAEVVGKYLAAEQAYTQHLRR